MAIGYGVAVPKPGKGESRQKRRALRRKLWDACKNAVWLRSGGCCEDCGAGPLLRGEDALHPRCGHIAHERGRRVAPADRFNPDACKLKCRDCHLAEHNQRF